MIDWFTVGAQIINFLILVFLLKRFLYAPIVKAMKEREERVLGRLRQAEEMKANADALATKLASERNELAESRERMLDDARQETEKWRQQAVAGAKAEIEKMRKVWLESLEADQESFMKRLKEKVSDLVFRISEKALLDLADGTLEKRVVDKFIVEFTEQKGNLFSHEKNSAIPLVISSGFVLSEETQKDLQKAIILQNTANMPEFKVKPEIGFGIRMNAGDKKIEWNISRYLKEMEEDVLAVIRASRSGYEEQSSSESA